MALHYIYIWQYVHNGKYYFDIYNSSPIELHNDLFVTPKTFIDLTQVSEKPLTNGAQGGV